MGRHLRPMLTALTAEDRLVVLSWCLETHRRELADAVRISHPTLADQLREIGACWEIEYVSPADGQVIAVDRVATTEQFQALQAALIDYHRAGPTDLRLAVRDAYDTLLDCGGWPPTTADAAWLAEAIRRATEVYGITRGGINLLGSDALERLVEIITRLLTGPRVETPEGRLATSERLTVPQVAERLGIDRSTVLHAISDGRLPAERLGAKVWLIAQADVDAYAASRRPRPSRPEPATQ